MTDFKVGDLVIVGESSAVAEVIKCSEKWVFIYFDNDQVEKCLRMELSLLPPQPFKNGQVLCVDISQRKGILIDYSQPRQFLAKFDYMIDKNYAYLTIEVDGERMYICAHINELSECLIDFEEEAA